MGSEPVETGKQMSLSGKEDRRYSSSANKTYACKTRQKILQHLYIVLEKIEQRETKSVCAGRRRLID